MHSRLYLIIKYHKPNEARKYLFKILYQSKKGTVIIMERSNKSISKILMFIGVLFVMIAGCVFVRNAWYYMNDTTKQICLFGLSAVMFFITAKLSKGDVTSRRLTYTIKALYYVGSISLGFFVYSVTGIWHEGNKTDLYSVLLQLLLGSMCVLACIIKLVITKDSMFDKIVCVILANNVAGIASLYFDLEFWQIIMLLVTINIIMSFILKLKNMLWVIWGISQLITLIQLISITMKGEAYCYPVAALFVVAYFVKYCLDKNETYLKLLIYQLVITVILYLEKLWHLHVYENKATVCVTFLLLVFTLLLADLAWICDKSSQRKELLTVTLFYGVICSCVSICEIFEVEYTYRCEFYCTIAIISIALVGRIWYDRINEIRKIQFVLSCIISLLMICHNLDVENIFCMLYLGILATVVLVLAALKNSKNYVILSSITLVLLVIYLTWNYLTSISWWIYLLAVGIILILVGIKKEKEA